MKCFKALCCCLLLTSAAFGQAAKKQLPAKRINSIIKIDGVLDESAWKNAPLANNFTELRPTPFRLESTANATEVYLLYSNEGIYVGGYLHEKTKLVKSFLSSVTYTSIIDLGANDGYFRLLFKNTEKQIIAVMWKRW